MEATERTKVFHVDGIRVTVVCPEEGVLTSAAPRIPHHLAGGVDIESLAVGAGNGTGQQAKVFHPSTFRVQKEVSKSGAQRLSHDLAGIVYAEGAAE